MASDVDNPFRRYVPPRMSPDNGMRQFVYPDGSPIMRGDVGAGLDFWHESKNMSVDFKCHGCGRLIDVDATDLLDEARDYFDDELERVEGE